MFTSAKVKGITGTASTVAIALLIVTLFLSACAVEDFMALTAEPKVISTPEPAGEAGDEASEGGGQLDENGALQRLVARAIADLAQAASANDDQIAVVSTEQVEWSDTSLGCPEADGMYAQVITPGYRIVLESGGRTYAYHSGTDAEGPLVQCNRQDDR